MAGHYISLNFIEPPSGIVKTILIGAWVYSGCILVVPLADFLWRQALNFIRFIIFLFRGSKLNQEEIIILEWIGGKGHDPVNLNVDMRDSPGLRKLEVLSQLKSLKAKRYVESGKYDELVVCLTPRGRKKAIELITAANEDFKNA